MRTAAELSLRGREHDLYELIWKRTLASQMADARQKRVAITIRADICQIYYHELTGDITEYASDKYQHNRDIQPSLLFMELNPQTEDDRQMKLDFGLERSHS